MRYVAWLICMGLTLLNVLFGLFTALHHLLILVRLDADIPANQIPVHLYTVGGLLALAGTVVMLRTDFGVTTSVRVLWLARTFLILGFAAIAIVPGGRPPGTWFTEFGMQEIFSVILPLSFIGYTIYMGSSIRGQKLRVPI